MGYRIKRVYEQPETTDGYRLLVDRLWPRGLSKDAAHVDEWVKEAGPSNELRKWFGHVPERFQEFARRYRKELANNDAIDQLRQAGAENDTVTLLYSAKDTEHNQAVVLRNYLTHSTAEHH